MAETTKYTIKPLEWEWFETSRKRGYQTQCPLFHMTIWQFYSPDGTWGEWLIGGTGMVALICDSPEHGKQLAEDHWQSYMKQGLIPVKEGES